MNEVGSNDDLNIVWDRAFVKVIHKSLDGLDSACRYI